MMDADLRAGVEVLGEAGDAGVGVGREGGIVLVEVLEAESVFLGGVVVEIGHGQVGRKPAGAGDEGVVEMGSGGGVGISTVVGDEPLARFAGKRRRVEQDERVGSMFAAGEAGAVVVVHDACEAAGGARVV